MAPKRRKNGEEEGAKGTTKKRTKRATKAAAHSSESEDADDGLDAQVPVPEDDVESVPAADTPPILEGDKVSGELLICGSTSWDMTGRKAPPKGAKPEGSGRNLWGPHRLAGALKGTAFRTVASGCLACHNVIITAEGKAYVFGRNDAGQLGLKDTVRHDAPTLVPSLQDLNIVQASCGKSHTLFLTEHGKVYACGANASGQLGLGSQSPSVNSPAMVKHGGPPIKRIACGGEFSAVVDINGNLYTFGSPEYGQLGHNTDGKYFVTSNKLGFSCETRPRRVMVFIDKARDGTITPVMDVEITDLACGPNHIVVLDKKERVFTWGFGAYGRLGHGDNKDEMIPRQLKFFDGPNRGAVKIAAGSTFCLAVSKLGALYLWGQTKAAGEAAMYPKPVNDLSGWAIKQISCCNKSIVLTADNSVISWGASPTYGELGYGEGRMKTSTVPEEVKTLEGVGVLALACGLGHTLFLARNESPEDKDKIQALPEFTP